MTLKRVSAITFGDAVKAGAPTAFSCMIKPVGSSCNLDCHYCYYIDKSRTIYDGKKQVMSTELLEEFTRQYIEANEIPEITFVWHGGEPLLAGIEFFRKAMKLQKKYAGGKKIINALQTNGTLVDAEWSRFFHDNAFLVGISVDGPRDIHSAYRVNRADTPAFDKVINAIDLFTKHRVDFNTLSVVNNRSEGRGVEVYRFLKSLGSRFMQFLPVFEFIRADGKELKPAIVSPGTPGSSKAPWSVSPQGYGRFLTDVFDEWILNDVGSYFVQTFDMTLAQWVGVKPGMCVYSETCGDALVVEHNGDIFSCDHFVYPEFRLGNIGESTLRELFVSPKQFAFGINKRNSLPRYCLRCKYYFACRGECPKHRFMTTETGEDNLNALCEGFKIYFAHVEPYMNEMKRLLLQKRPPALVMELARKNQKT